MKYSIIIINVKGDELNQALIYKYIQMNQDEDKLKRKKAVNFRELN